MNNKNPRRRVVWALLPAAVVALVIWVQPTSAPTAAAEDLEFHDLRAQTLQFIRYNRDIKLTVAQEAVKRMALSRMHAVCCDDETAYTCCCECNLSRTVWGLSNHLIAERGYTASQVSQKVSDWLRFIGPDGFSGAACYQGGCGRAFNRDGCGGMNEASVVF